MAELIRPFVNESEIWPNNLISDWGILNILVYDSILEEGDIAMAHSFKKNVSDILIISFPQMESNLFRDWYLPIYELHGLKAINDFLNYIKFYAKFPISSNKSQINPGEFLHIWSQTVGTDLRDLAYKAFGWRSEYQKQFQKAREQYQNYNYTVDEADYSCSKPPAENSNSYAVVIWISVSALTIILVLISAVFALQRRNGKLDNGVRKLTKEELKEFYVGTSKPEQISGKSLFVADGFNKKFEISRNSLQIYKDEVLGSGEYAVVLQGMFKPNGHSTKKGEAVKVAVKIPKPHVGICTFKALLTELKVMANMGWHVNIVALVGAVTDRIKHRELIVAIEYCEKGDLLAYLKEHRLEFKDLLKNTNVSPTANPGSSNGKNHIELQVLNGSSLDYTNPPKKFSTLNLLEWSTQVSNGMVYISSKNVIHGDLAARNVLLTENNVAKISDFGLSRQLINYNNYQKQSKSFAPVPWRWMALESLKDMEFSLQSDIWAFGVTLYEIFSLGSTPYPTFDWTEDFVDELSSGYRLGMPKLANSDIYQLMMDCMKKEPVERIKFPEISNKLQNMYTMLLNSKSGSERCIYVALDDGLNGGPV